MKRTGTVLTTLAAAVMASASMAQSNYVIGGPSAGLSPSSGVLGWDGQDMAAYRAAVDNPVYFGSSGYHTVRVQTRSLAHVDEQSLAGVDAFVCSYWNDAEITQAQSDALVDFFLGGGDLIVIGDNHNYDAIADRLGVKILSGFNETSGETAPPLGAGSFGFVANDTVSLTAPGYVDAGRVLSKNGHVGVVTPFTLAAAAWWSKGDFGPRTGALVILADPGLITDGDYGANDDLSRFALNMTEYLSNRDRVKVIGGPAGSLQPSTSVYRWETGAFTGDVKYALSRSDNFGRFAPGEVDVRIHFYESINTGNLGLCDSFLSPFWRDADLSAAQRNAILAAHQGGMDLIVWLDDIAQGSLLTDLNIGMSTGISGTATISDPLSTGPFGTVSSLNRNNSRVTLDHADIVNQGGYIAAEDGNQQPIAAYFLEKDLAGHNANLVVITDASWMVDGSADYDAMNASAQFTLNTFYHALTDRKIRVAGPSSNLNPSSHGWDGSALVNFRTALARPDYFGPQGHHRRGIDVLEMSVLDELTLATMDVFVSGLWNDHDITTSQIGLINKFVERGGRALLTPEDNGADLLTNSFGLQTQDVSASLTTGSSPSYAGPFGSASVVDQFSSAVHFDEPALLAMGGQVVGRNSADEVAVALLNQSSFAPRSGEVLAIGDVHQLTLPDYNVLTVETIFVLNSIAYLADLLPAAPRTTHYGYGYPGAGGLVPTLSLEGGYLGNTLLRLRIANAAGRSPVLLVIGTTGQISFQYRDATILVNLPWTVIPLSLGGAPGAPGEGIADVVSRLDPGIQALPPGFELQMQALVLDAQASDGVAASDAMNVAFP
jgi:hypothetical protein